MKKFLLAIVSIVLLVQCFESFPMYEIETYRPYGRIDFIMDWLKSYGFGRQYGADDRSSYGYGDRHDGEYGPQRYGYDNDRFGGYGERRSYGYGGRYDNDYGRERYGYDNDRYGVSRRYVYGDRFGNDYGRERYGIVGYGPDDRYSVFGKRLVLGYGRQDY